MEWSEDSWDDISDVACDVAEVLGGQGCGTCSEFGCGYCNEGAVLETITYVSYQGQEFLMLSVCSEHCDEVGCNDQG